MSTAQVAETTELAVRSPGHETCHHTYYRLTCEEFEELLHRSGGRCEICGADRLDNYGGKLYVDHDGFRGFAAVRGLVCSKCNGHLRRVDAGERLHDSRTIRYYMRSYRGGPLRRDFVAWIAGDYVTHNAERLRWIGTGGRIMSTNVRHKAVPTPDACRWCGVDRRDHARRWVPSRRWHAWAEPTPAQRKARMLARRQEAAR